MREVNENIGLFLAEIVVDVLKMRLNEAAVCLLNGNSDYSAALTAAKRLERAEIILERLRKEPDAAPAKALSDGAEYMFS